MERKEAIEIVRKLYNESLFLKKDKEAMVTLIPEIEESEDEMIKKELIQFFSDKDEEDYEGMHPRAQIIAWLEKQDKCKIDCPQNHQDSNFPNGCIVLEDFNGGEGFYKVHLDYLSKKQVEEIEEIIRVWNKELKTSNEKQGEQKPPQEIEPTPIFRIGDVIKRKGKDYTFRVDRIQGGYYHCDRNYGAYFPIEDQDNWELVEQNPEWTPMDEQRVENLLAIIEGHGYPGEVAWLNSLEDRVQPKQKWSEEDERYISYILTNCMYYAEKMGYVEEKNNSIIHQQAKDWLKALKERVQSQPIQEWSKEDEKNSKNILYILNQLKGTAIYKEDKTAEICIDWFKSLKDRYTWKPSEGQMKALSNALSLANNCGEENAFDLRTLYEQLKKLREE